MVSQEPAETSDGVFARRLHELRKTAGLTQQQLAAAMAAAGNTMHRSAIAKIEAGDRSVSVGEAVQLAAVLGVGLVELLTERASDTEREREHRARVEAQMAVQALQRETAQRQKLVREAQVLYENTQARLEAAQRRLADLGGNPADPPAGDVLASLAGLSIPLTPGEDDR